MDVRLVAAVLAGKLAGAAARRLGRGGGTALPGLVAERVDPSLARKLGRSLGRGRVLVTGTNGKTTTSRIVARALQEAGVLCLHNREGSNLMRGIASALLGAAGPSGRIGNAAETLGLFETDEATLPPAVRALAPRAIAFTNLFRDQLDRYGEVDTVAALWREALTQTPQDATLVLNADDPSVAELGQDWTGPVHWFGLNDPAFATERAGAFDARWCRACGGSFAYDRRYFAHIGHWRCAGCGRARQTPATSASDVRLGLDSATFTVGGLGEVSMPLTGVYNVYNALAAIALCRVLELPDAAIVAGLANVRAAFGRQEVVEIEGRRLRLLLCKNPAGANQVLRLLASLARGQWSGPGGQGDSLLSPQSSVLSRDSTLLPPPPSLRVAALLNDRFADGRDVSWIWDVDYEIVAGSVATCWAGGDRAADMALRLKYAGWPAASAVAIEPACLLDAILAGSRTGDDVFVVATYTAMLDFRAELQVRGATGEFWAR